MFELILGQCQQDPDQVFKIMICWIRIRLKMDRIRNPDSDEDPDPVPDPYFYIYVGTDFAERKNNCACM